VALILIILIMARLIRGVGRAAQPMADLVDASGRVEAGEVGTQVSVRGPRELRSLGRAFNSMSARLAADNEQRRRLLADVSHELRTPLTVIQGNVEAMLDGVYPADRAHLERLLAETRHLERLIEDLRTMSLADAGALPLHREPTDLAELAAKVVDGFAARASSAGVSLGVEATEAPALALDPHRFRQVIGNLVSNALRHTPKGGTVTVRVRPSGDRVVLEVADTGSGMDAASAERAFDRFWRSGERAGAGIGLAIVRDLVLAHGGEVSLQTAPGEGTTVRCSLPLTSARA
jgi:two-component system sensor histidine kinase BaeS